MDQQLNKILDATKMIHSDSYVLVINQKNEVCYFSDLLAQLFRLDCLPKFICDLNLGEQFIEDCNLVQKKLERISSLLFIFVQAFNPNYAYIYRGEIKLILAKYYLCIMNEVKPILTRNTSDKWLLKNLDTPDSDFEIRLSKKNKMIQQLATGENLTDLEKYLLFFLCCGFTINEIQLYLHEHKLYKITATNLSYHYYRLLDKLQITSNEFLPLIRSLNLNGFIPKPFLNTRLFVV